MKYTIKYLIVVFFILIGNTVVAQNNSDFTEEHLAAAERVVYSIGIPESLIIPTEREIQLIQKSDPAKAQALSAASKPFLEKQYIGSSLKVFVASELDAETCRKIADFWEGPVGRKFVGKQVELLSSGNTSPLQFSPDEEEAMSSFEKTKAFQDFTAAMPKILLKANELAKEIKEKMSQRIRVEHLKDTPQNPK